VNETICIGNDIRVTLLGVDGDKIKIGIDAPREVKVFREELLEATRSTNRQAVQAPVVVFDTSKLKLEPEGDS
jgi:carbon storage regulator